jgi:hypothetical protein
MEATQTTPDTAAYLYLGLAALAIIMGAFLASMVVRYRNLQKDLQLIDQLKEDKS